MKKKVMILSASAGSGHVRAAAALEEAARKDDRVGEVLNIDALEYTNKMFQRIYSKGYLDAVKNAPELWSWAFEATDKPWQRPPVVYAFHKMNSQPLVKKLQEFKPDICLCTHGMPAEIISHLILRDRLQTNLGIVVTDYYVHALWVMDIFTRYFVPKEESKAHLCAIGLPRDRIEVSGIPILEDFTVDNDRDALRSRYGFEPDIPLVVLSAGAFGVMSADDILRVLEEIKTPCRIVVVCGHNDKLKKKLEACIANEDRGVHNAYTVVGYTTAMHEYLAMADLFVGKPGGLTTSECLAMGVPMVIWDPIPGQEVYNSYHILEQGAGVMPNNALTIGYKIDRLLGDQKALARMKKNAKAIAYPTAARDILDAMLANEDETPVKAFKRTPR